MLTSNPRAYNRDMNTQKLLPHLKSHKEILFSYLFGSQATGKARRESDVDIAVYLSKKIGSDQTLDWRLRLMAELSPVLGTDKVDVVILNEAPLVLRYEIVSKGKLLVNRDAKREMAFKLWTLDEYFDTAPMRAMFRRVMRQKIEEGNFFGQSRSA
mgnify:CR=1 FL=1